MSGRPRYSSGRTSSRVESEKTGDEITGGLSNFVRMSAVGTRTATRAVAIEVSAGTLAPTVLVSGPAPHQKLLV